MEISLAIILAALLPALGILALSGALVFGMALVLGPGGWGKGRGARRPEDQR